MAFDDTIDNSTRPPSDWDAKDLGMASVKGLLSNIPLIGGSAGEVFGLAIATSLARRRDDWLESVALRLLKLQVKVDGFTVERLGDDEQFVSTVMQATAAAVRTHQKEKLEALRNAVLNTALRIPIEEAEQQMFLAWADQFTEWHLSVLLLLTDPRGWANEHSITFPSWGMGARGAVVEYALPELNGRRDFYDQIVRDLHQRGLLVTDSLHVTVTGDGMLQPLGTEAAGRFMAYVGRPRELAE
jgi:hypothetical protein